MHKNILPLTPKIHFRHKQYGTVLILMGLYSCASAAPKSYSPFADVPHGDPAYTALKQLVKAGIVHSPSICFPSDRGYKYDLDHRTLTRYEFAVAMQRAMAVAQSKKNQTHRKPTTQEIAFQTAVNKLAVEFRCELAQLNR